MTNYLKQNDLITLNRYGFTPGDSGTKQLIARMILTGKLLSSYLSNRKQRVVLNGQTSDLGHIHSGVPQGSVSGPPSFLIFINDFEAGIIPQTIDLLIQLLKIEKYLPQNLIIICLQLVNGINSGNEL